MSVPSATSRRPNALHDPAGPGRLATAVLAMALLAAMGYLTEFDPRVLFDPATRRGLLGFLGSFLPPETAPDFLREALQQTWLTLAMATCGMTLALLLALPSALLLTRMLSLSALGRPGEPAAPVAAALRAGLRMLMILLRSIPELVWALLLVRVVGLGPAAGVFAIAITYAGMLAKVYAEIFESTTPAPVLALLQQGAGRLQAFGFGLLPQCVDEMISYTVYRWECAVRTSMVLGFVGAGGLGQMLDTSIKMFRGGEVATLLLIFVLLVALADAISATLRRLWA